MFPPTVVTTFTLIILAHFSISTKPTAVVLWHGMGDTCCNEAPGRAGYWKKEIERNIPGIYVYSIRIGKSAISDMMHSFMGDINNMVNNVCKKLAKDSNLAEGYNAIGFSQGSQFLRAVAERCPYPPMKKLISLGGQHQGIYGWEGPCSSCIPKSSSHIWLFQKSIQASYWHDPIHEQKYRKSNKFIADINNEGPVYKQHYKDNFQKLEKLVLVKFEWDSMVIPIETQWFGFFEPGQAENVIPMFQTNLYKNDTIGMRQMYIDGKVDFLSIEDDHLEFTYFWFLKCIIGAYLTNMENEEELKNIGAKIKKLEENKKIKAVSCLA